MKALALILLLLAVPAKAQTGPEVYRPISGAQLVSVASFSTTATAAFIARLAQFTCTVSCYFSFVSTPYTVTMAPLTGWLMVPNTPYKYEVISGQKISVIRDSGNGTLHIQELSR